MLALELIVNDIPSLKTSDPGLFALSLMDEYRVGHLPIVNNKDFLGLISEDDILALDAPEESIGAHKLSLVKPFVYEQQHIYEAIRLTAELKLTMVPVLKQDGVYSGQILLADLAQAFSNLASLHEPGGILILELNHNDFSMSEVAQIIESNDARILSSYLGIHPDSTKIDLTLKINRTDLSRVIQTFDRYDYTIKASYSENRFSDDWNDRYDEFINYLNM